MWRCDAYSMDIASYILPSGLIAVDMVFAHMHRYLLHIAAQIQPMVGGRLVSARHASICRMGQ